MGELLDDAGNLLFVGVYAFRAGEEGFNRGAIATELPDDVDGHQLMPRVLGRMSLRFGQDAVMPVLGEGASLFDRQIVVLLLEDP